MKHIILVGACYLDTILSVPHFPEEDSKLRATQLQVRRGGNCANSLEVLQQLIHLSDGDGDEGEGEGVRARADVKLHLVSSLPSRSAAATRSILESFGPDCAVDFDHCLYREGHDQAASSYIIRSVASGSRTIVNYNDLPEMTVDEFVSIADVFKSQEAETWWHFEGRIPETTLRCIQHLRGSLAKCQISVEVEKPNREGLRELAAEADVVFYSRTWAEYFFRPVSVPPGGFKVVDTIGAGDTFIAGMLFGIVCHGRDWDIPTKLSFAVDLASCKVQLEGFQGLGRAAATQTSRF